MHFFLKKFRKRAFFPPKDLKIWGAYDTRVNTVHYLKILRNNRCSPNKALEGKFWEAEYTFMVFDAKLANGGFSSEALI